VPHLSSNASFRTDLDRQHLYKLNFSAIPGISRNQLAQVSNDGYAQVFHGIMILIPAPLPSEISHIANVSPLLQRYLSILFRPALLLHDWHNLVVLGIQLWPVGNWIFLTKYLRRDKNCQDTLTAL
jgi:hypothetical protein